ncbi:MAG: pyrimidine biosynthesis enzyme [Dehalococcoidia bacterium]|nr:pyrimidine biosynthesis enzyme [Dehalococcoidia bacterium]
MRRTTALLVVILGIALLLFAAGCGGDDRESVSLALDWYPNANHAGLFIAQERGYFTEEDLDVRMYTPSDPSTVLQTVGAGKDDFGISYQPDVLLARAAGIPVVSVAGLVQHPLNSVMALTSSGITRPRDLSGKTVGYPGIPLDEPLLKTMVEHDGGDFSTVKLVNIGFDLVPALLSKRVDAVVGAYWTHENILAEQQGEQVTILRMEEWGVPDFYELVLVTNETMLKVKPHIVFRLLQAMLRGYNEAAANLDNAVDTLVKQNPEIEGNRALEERGIRLLAPAWTDGVPSFGWQTTEQWQDFIRWMDARQLLAKPVKAEEAFTNGFIAELVQK